MSQRIALEAAPAAWVDGADGLFPKSLPAGIRGYELEEELFTLGPSTFFAARNVVLRHPLLVRRLVIDPARPTDARETFFREQRHAAALAHPHVSRPTDVFEAEGHLWSVHERWEGVASSTYVRERGPLDVATAARLGAQIADALGHMHAQGFVHGKVHPYGIGIGERGDAQLYNLVKSADLAAGIWPLRPVVAGLSPFSSPEEHAGQKPTAASDLFSLAATLCFWMCGVEPRDDETVDQWMVRSKAQHEPEPGDGKPGSDPGTCDGRVPSSVIDAIRFALEPDPAKRRGTVDALGSLLIEAHQRLASETPTGFSTGATLEPEGAVGHVTIVGRRGAGAFGVVFEAAGDTAGRRLAVKALKPEHRDDQEARQRFLREARAMHAVHHPSVVRIHAVGEERGTPYAIMDFVSGPDLNQVLKVEGALEPGRVARLGAGIAQGLSAIHAEGIVHRDLKPHNILLEDGEIPRIADFGIAHQLETTRITGTGRIVGTPAYMAPEQFGGGPVSASVDLYAFGTMLYEMLAGEPPFAGLDLVNTIRAVREQAPAPLPEGVPAALRGLVSQLMAKDPASRPSAADASALLARAGAAP